MSNDAKFWDKTAKKYAASPIKNIEAYNQTLDRTKTYLSSESQVLEIGCGTGSTALLLADSVAHITASDISQEMLAIGADKARGQQIENVTFQHSPLPGTAFGENTYDAVLAFNILHLVRDLPGVLKAMHKALKPGGVFISKTPCIAQQTRLWAIPIAIARAIGFAPYVTLLTFKKIEDAFKESGFDLIETCIFDGGAMSRFIVAKKI